MSCVLNRSQPRVALPPSRDTNPFATCWTRPGALPWIETSQLAPAAIVDRLAVANWRGQIVGPHGVGKSTLMRALEDPLLQAGRRVVWWEATREGQRAPFDSLEHLGPESLLLVEGFERLGRRERSHWLRATREAKIGLLVTTHRRLRAWRSPPAVVAHVEPPQRLLGALFERLAADRPTPVTLDDALASFSQRRGNVREVWFDLYDLHEQRTRQHRTTGRPGP